MVGGANTGSTADSISVRIETSESHHQPNKDKDLTATGSSLAAFVEMGTDCSPQFVLVSLVAPSSLSLESFDDESRLVRAIAMASAQELMVEQSPPPPSEVEPTAATEAPTTTTGTSAWRGRGIIGLALCNSPEFVATALGAKPVFGTNPLAVSVPLSGSD
jgi:hypothetical protein